jgi:hypothetical protein
MYTCKYSSTRSWGREGHPGVHAACAKAVLELYAACHMPLPSSVTFKLEICPLSARGRALPLT